MDQSRPPHPGPNTLSEKRRAETEVNGFSRALLEDYADKLDEEGRGYLQEVRGASREMAQLIDDVLQLARVTRSEMRREVVNLSELAQSVVAELRRRSSWVCTGLC